METENKQGMERRTFLRKVGVTALATAWAAPIIQTVPASVAHATGLQTPHPGTTTTGTNNSGGGGDTGGDSGGGDTGGDSGGGDTGDNGGGGWSGGGNSEDD